MRDAPTVHASETPALDTRPARRRGKSQGDGGRAAGSRMQYLTPPAVAARLGVKPETVLGWIASGELRAINVARRGAKRPRFRISPAALADFEAGRAVAPESAPRARRRRADRPAGWVEYY